MMGSRSKQKGAQFERDVCRALSLWLSGGDRDDLFWRSAMSGGRATLAAGKLDRAAQEGDCTPIDRAAMRFADTFVVECKAYASLDTHMLFYGSGAARIATFFDQTRSIAEAGGRLPFLVAKQDRMPVVVCVCYAGFELLESAALLSPTVDVPPLEMIVLKMQDVVSVPPRSLRRAMKTWQSS